jgi:hypothetical protein
VSMTSELLDIGRLYAKKYLKIEPMLSVFPA